MPGAIQQYSRMLNSASGRSCTPGTLPSAPGAPGEAPCGRFLKRSKVLGRFWPGLGGPETLLQGELYCAPPGRYFPVPVEAAFIDFRPGLWGLLHRGSINPAADFSTILPPPPPLRGPRGVPGAAGTDSIQNVMHVTPEMSPAEQFQGPFVGTL